MFLRTKIFPRQTKILVKRKFFARKISCCENVHRRKVAKFFPLTKNTYVNRFAYLAHFIPFVENSVDNVENSGLSIQISPFSPFLSTGFSLHNRLHNFKFCKIWGSYVSVATTCFFLQICPKSFLFFLSVQKNAAARHKPQKFFVELLQIPFPYENFPTGDTGNIFIFQEGVCRARWKSAV